MVKHQTFSEFLADICVDIDLKLAFTGINEKNIKVKVISTEHTPSTANGDLTLASFCIAILIALAIWTHYQPIPPIDEYIMLAFRSATDPAVAIGPEWLSVHFRDFTTLGSNWFLLLLTVITAVVCKVKGLEHTALFLVLTVVSGMILSFALKLGFDRPRPELVPHSTRVYTSSFPSGHAMMSSLTYACLAIVGTRAVKERQLALWFVAIAVLIVVLVGLSRVFLGVHWPTDVLAGWSAGIAWLCLCRRVLDSRTDRA